MMHALVPLVPLPEEPLVLDELNHRIINEFTGAIAMISRAAARSGSDEVKRALNDVAQLLHNYAQVHRVLQPPATEVRVNAEGYLSDLCRAIARSRLDPARTDLVLEAWPLLLQASRCWRLGMIVSELVANAARHAFEGRHGEIKVVLVRAGAFVSCTVSDNGSAPALVRPGRGSRLVEALSRSLRGRFERQFGPRGSASTVIFPYADQEADAALCA